jgi:flagella basal body P-ring formation protein FlgA
MRALALILALAAAPAAADTLVAARTLRAQAILTAADLALAPGVTPGALSDPADAIGMEARVVLYAGRPLRPADLGPPAIVERNQIVTLLYRSGGLEIAAEGRALGRAGAGDSLRVLNLGSRSTVTGRVGPDGTVEVTGGAARPQ